MPRGLMVAVAASAAPGMSLIVLSVRAAQETDKSD
jgi:hypothetical protein